MLARVCSGLTTEARAPKAKPSHVVTISSVRVHCVLGVTSEDHNNTIATMTAATPAPSAISRMVFSWTMRRGGATGVHCDRGSRDERGGGRRGRNSSSRSAESNAGSDLDARGAGSEAILLQPAVERAAAQAERIGCLADVATIT